MRTKTNPRALSGRWSVRVTVLVTTLCLAAFLSLGLGAADVWAKEPRQPGPDGQVAPARQEGGFADLPGGLLAGVARTLSDDLPADYHLQSKDSGYIAANAAQDLEADFTSTGPEVTVGGETWGLTLAGWGRSERVEPVSEAEPSADGPRLVYRRGAVTEWYLNTPWGLEQGFTLESAPDVEEVEGDLVLELTLSGSLSARQEDDTTLRLENVAGEVVARYAGLYAYDAQGRQLPARLELEGTLRIVVDDTGAQYPLTIDPWIQRAKLTGSDLSGERRLGYSVAISGTTVVVGAQSENNFTGAVYIFEEPGGGWANMTPSAKLLASDGVNGDKFSESVAISGDTIVVGAPVHTPNGTDTGAAYVFERPAGGWTGTLTETAKLLASDGVSGGNFGDSVAISGDTIVVGAPNQPHNSTSTGPAYIFERPAGGWGGTLTETATLESPDVTVYFGSPIEGFGDAVAIDDDIIVVGYPFGTNGSGNYSGTAYVFERSGVNWSDMTAQTAKLEPSSGVVYDEFGKAVAISGDTMVIGAPETVNNTTGAAYVFERPTGGWTGTLTETAQLLADDGAASDNFGYDVDISGDTVVAGAYGTDVNGQLSGSAYVFIKGSEWTSGSANQAAKLLPSDGESNDYFGYAVAVESDTVIAGAYVHDGGAGSAYVFEAGSGWSDTSETAMLDIPGGSGQLGYSVALAGDTVFAGAPYVSDNGYESGAVYIFEKGSGWADMTEVAKLLPSDGVRGAQFGFDVDVDGDSVVVGAPYDDDNGGSGSVYVFEKPVGGWTGTLTETAKLSADDAQADDTFGYAVAISGDTIVVGSQQDDDNGESSGSVYVFERPGGGWADITQTAKLLASDGEEFDRLGEAVAIDGDTIVAGAWNDRNSVILRGAAYVFVEPVGGWAGTLTETARILPNEQILDESVQWFGSAVAVEGDTVVIGSESNYRSGGLNSMGKVYIFEEPGTGWTDTTQHDANLVPETRVPYESFGRSVDISGERVVVGTGSSYGSAYVFERPGAGWSGTLTETVQLRSSDIITDDQFGRAVAISDYTIVVGAYGVNSYAGAAYVFGDCFGSVENVDTGETFCKIQPAIDDPDTLDGHTLVVSPGVYTETLVIDKELTLRGATYNVNKNGYAVPADYAWDETVESIISAPNPFEDGIVVDIVTGSVTLEGFVVQSLYSTGGGGSGHDPHLVRVEAHHQPIDNVVVRNNVIGPNTHVTLQDGTLGRMGLYLALPNYTDGHDITNSRFAGNKIFNCEGNGNNVFIWGGAEDYNPVHRGDLSGTVIEDNEIYGSHRSGIEIAGSADNLTIRDNAIYDNSGLPGDDPAALKYGNGIVIIRMGSDKTSTTGEGPVGLTIVGNEIVGNEKNGIYMGPINAQHVITGNIITNNGWDGVRVDLEESYHSGATPVYTRTEELALNENVIANNTGHGARVIGTPENGFVLDARVNWWDDVAGPGGEGPGSGDEVGAHVMYCPWLDAAPPGGGPTSANGNLVTNVDSGELFCAIQSAIDDADTSAGDTLTVTAGTYVEDLLIDKSLTLEGPFAGTPGVNAGRGTGEAVILPVVNDVDPGSGDSVIVQIEADDVTIDGFTIDGDNPALNGGASLNGVDANAAYGIAYWDAAHDNTTIRNNVFRNLVRNGIYLWAYGAPVPAYGSITYNYFDNLSSASPNGKGMYIGYDYYADISHNVLERVFIGIQHDNLTAPTGNPSTITNNEISSYRTGIWYNNNRVDAATTTIANNILTAEPTGTNAGLWISSLMGNASVEVVDNDVTNSNAGLQLWNLTTSEPPTITGGTLDGNNYGVFAYNYSGSFGAGGATTAWVEHITVTNAITAGIYVQDDPVSGTHPISVTVENATLSGNSLSAKVENGRAELVLKGSDMNNETTVFEVSGGTLTAYANNVTNFSDGGLDSSTGTLNARHNWWGTHSAQPTGVDNDSWAYRLGAPVSGWGEGTLGDAALTTAGGSGTGIIVSHGRGLANVPFGKGEDPHASDMCSDYYDFFVLNPGGDWTVSVPTDARAECDATRTDGSLYQFALSGDQPDAACDGGDCWNLPSGVTLSGDQLEVTVSAMSILQGTPFVAGDASPDSTDPTAITLDAFGATSARAWMPVVGLLIAVLGVVIVRRKRR